jgi:hypothetical protein
MRCQASRNPGWAGLLLCYFHLVPESGRLGGNRIKLSLVDTIKVSVITVGILHG